MSKKAELTSEEEAGWFVAQDAQPWWQWMIRMLISSGPIPRHVAFVMDGNRRYAKTKHLGNVIRGHEKGFVQLARVLDWCNRFGIKEITVYAFSIENFKRSEEEVSGLMRLAEEKFQKLLNDNEKLEEKRIAFRFYGNRKLLSARLCKLMDDIEEATKDYDSARLNVCMPYTSRDEIARSFETIRQQVKLGNVAIDDIDEKMIDACLDSGTGLPVDLFVRTSGECRLSDFLMWQSATTHIYFTDVLWPEFGYYQLCKAILNYQYYRSTIRKIPVDTVETEWALEKTKSFELTTWPDKMDTSGAKDTCVQVALRIRPQGNREKLEGSRVCTSVLPNEPQVIIGGDRSFTYDYVFDQPTPQHVVYESCVQKLVDGLFDGFNATVLAYGQTGSGKTHTMGTAFDTVVTQQEQDLGVIPRAIHHTFRRIAECKAEALEKGILEPSFEVSVQFVELYNDDVLDLLSDDRNNSSNIRIHEDNRGEIVLHGVEQRTVHDLDGTMEILKNGALNRTVAATNMNEQSSRSHAIFTLHVKQQRGETEMEVLSAKFHFVDLAGSERMKRTGATGERAREGISINVGLLALGNVIAALGGANGKVSHVPYRDSKLTRLLQDSLGGNSRTLMIACCSPSDSDFVETLNTMKYANRAKEIKNKVVANQDKSSKMIGELRGRIAALEAELLEFKQGRRTVDVEGNEVVNDQYHENVYLTSEVNHLRFRVKALTETAEILRTENVKLKSEKELAALGGVSTEGGEGGDEMIQATFRKYLEELERTKSLLYESQSTCDQLRKENNRWKAQAGNRGVQDYNSTKLIEMARQDIENQRKMLASMTVENGSTSDYSSMSMNTGDEDGTSNDADEIEDEESDDEIDDELEKSKQASEAHQIDLHEVMVELDIKEKLIDQLERAERQNQQIRETYEKKLRELMNRIKETESERDRVLTEGGKAKGGKMSDEQLKNIKQEYERKITDLRKELKKIEALDKEHMKVIAKSQRELQEKTRLKSEVVDLKKAKVELIKKMNEDKKKQKQLMQAQARAMATKEKQTRLQANKIRTLEMKDKQREQFLKKTTSEVNQLRKEKAQAAAAARLAARGNASSRTPVARTPVASSRAARTAAVRNLKELSFSPKQAKLKWNALERKIEECVRKRQTIRIMEEELERYLKERHNLMLEIVENEKAFTQSENVIYRDGLLEVIDSAKEKLQYVQDQITYQQKLIVDVDQQVNFGLYILCRRDKAN
ncbi:unnamed protein product [Caenorhabditis bovis]|uniref:ditrans,polycis-polyprenyl diphosphate synthase [(2E,6E)-farnesyldiphosphate specific] n=1 Tax=Caenorhabditis bovis TaxID=2654633 RepID=A0A8S1EWD4_9PELO|nr:unnamed protein product [Caenorhabditis bovis]